MSRSRIQAVNPWQLMLRKPLKVTGRTPTREGRARNAADENE